MTDHSANVPPGDVSQAIGRRGFLDAVLATGFVSTALAFTYPVWRYLNPPQGGEPETASAVAAKVADMKVNSGVVFKFGEKPGLLVRTADGEFHAFSAVCTHLNCTVQYRPASADIWCACHNGIYDVAGANISGPPPRPLDPLVVNVRGGAGQEEVVVSRA